MNKKSQLAIIVFVVILLAIIGTLMYFGIKNMLSKEPEIIEPEPTISLYLQAYEPETDKYLSLNYSLEFNQQVYKTGTLQAYDNLGNPIINEISNLPINQTWLLYIWNQDYYLSKVIFPSLRTDYTYKINLHKNLKKGEINISYKGTINENSVNKIILNISVRNGTLKNLMVCYDSHGFTYIRPRSTYIECLTKWQNSTPNHPLNNSFGYLPKPYYYCAKTKQIVKCELIGIYTCIPQDYEVPPDLERQIDFCIYTGKTLESDYYTEEIAIKTTSINELSFLRIIAVDFERVRDNFCDFYSCYHKHNRWNGEDVGIPDVVYEINPFFEKT